MAETGFFFSDEGGINVRSMAHEDIGAVALLTERANAMRDQRPLPEALDNQDFANELQARMTKPGFWAYVALDRDVTGYILGYPTSEVDSIETDPDSDYLSLLMVDPDYQGRGIASGLLDTVADQLRQAGKKHLVLWTGNGNNEHARAVYEHKGYKLTNQTRVSERHGPQVQYLLDL